MNTDYRALAIWTSVHDNGWVANAVERPDGTFAAWAAREATADVDYVADGPENAMLAADFALRHKAAMSNVPRCVSDGGSISTSYPNRVAVREVGARTVF